MRPGTAFWVTGLPGSGKTTLALAVKAALPGLVLLQMDEMRKVVTPAPSYSEMERDLVYRGLVFAAMVLTREGRDVVIDATANRRVWRDLARSHIADFHEIFVECPVEICREREMRRVDALAPKDIYGKAEKGAPVPGVNVPYEEPTRPELVIENDRLTPPEAAEKLVSYVRSKLNPAII